MSNRAAEYRQMVEDIVANRHLLDEDEWQQLGDLVKKVIGKIQPADQQQEAAE